MTAHAFREPAVHAMGRVFEAAGLSADEGRLAAREVAFVVGLSAGSAIHRWHQPILLVAGGRGVLGITLGTTVYLKNREALDSWPLLVHETVHVAQVLRLGQPRFLANYAAEYVKGRLGGRSDRDAYLELSDEREARHIEQHAWAHGVPATPWLRDRL